ncbi:MAG: hypothetical protein GF350_13085, partial [Chitinivibrionales bacterium]|nr:hypothetical protein [Chitinivibrionales bacterium]
MNFFCAALKTIHRNSTWGLRRFLQRKGILKPRAGETVTVLSYPKSGRTWLRVMLDYLDICTRFTHDTAESLHNSSHDFPVSTDKDRYSKTRLVFLIRDPRDIVVSSYYHTVYKKGLFNGPISSFIRHHKFGIEKTLRFQNCWLEHGAILSTFLLVSYEDMLGDTTGELMRIVRFAGAESYIREEQVNEAVEIFTFKTMQRLERSGLLRMRYGGMLRVKDKRDVKTFKVRSGGSGAYRRELSSEDISYCNALIS